MTNPVEIRPVLGLAEVREGDVLGRLVADALARHDEGLTDGDVLVLSQKVVSKAEGRTRDLAAVEPGERARKLAASLGKDPRLTQLILDESRAVIRAERNVLIVETLDGWICANAGIDASNVPGDEHVTLLPEDADASARRIRGELRLAAGTTPAVVIADSFGRPWRRGQADVAIGCAGLVPLDDWRGRVDRHARRLAATEVAVADEVVAAADLVRDKNAGVPVVLIRGLGRWVSAGDGPGAGVLRRAEAEDLFR